MTKISARKAFSDVQVANLVQLVNRILEDQAPCENTTIFGNHNPVIELKFKNHAKLTLEVREHDYLATVKSATPLSREDVERAAHNTHRDKDGDTAKSYDSNDRRFSFESEDLRSLSYFVAAFAKAQRTDATASSEPREATPVTTPARTTPVLSRDEVLTNAKHEFNILQHHKRIASGELVRVSGTDACIAPAALREFRKQLAEDGYVIRKPGSKAIPVAQIFLPEVVVGNRTLTDNSTHYVDLIPLLKPGRLETDSVVAAVPVTQKPVTEKLSLEMVPA